ncbi:MAG: hypothetical protein QOE65_1160 [Solirubrobacteraceae bacterium]|nr:hypothetical protein [Solirubrobacteraceae bacterium]
MVEKGQRLVLIDGEDLPRIALALRELSVERHARWIARVDGRRSRLLVALDDDAVRADELEAALHRVQGSVTQAKIDQFFSPHAFAQWLDRIRSESE